MNYFDVIKNEKLTKFNEFKHIVIDNYLRDIPNSNIKENHSTQQKLKDY